MIGAASLDNRASQVNGSRKPSIPQMRISRASLKSDLSRMRKKLREMFSTTTVSISIESSGLKTLVTKGRKVVQWRTIPLDEETVKDGLVVDPIRLGEKIGESFRGQDKLPRKAIASVTGLHSLSRLVTLPKTPNRFLKEAISRESHRAMPVSLEYLDLSWQILETGNGALPVYILATPQNILNGQVQAMSHQGIDPYLMDMKPLALARAANRHDALILDIQPEEFDIVLVADGIPVITRTVLFPQGRSSMDVGEERIVIVVEEFLRTVKFFETTHDGKPLNPDTPLFLTGEANNHPALQEMVARATKFPITPMEPPLKYPSTFPVAEYATNVGLNLKELLPTSNGDNEAHTPEVNFNILPNRHRKQTRVSKKLLWALGIIAGIALLVPIYQGSIDASVETAIMRAELSKAEQGVTLKALDTKRHYEFQQSVDQAEASVGALKAGHEAFLEKSIPFAKPLDVIMDSLPDGIRINTFGDNAGVIGVSGDADSYDAVVSYTQRLARTAGFPDATILFVQGGAGTTQETSKVSFQLSVGRYVPENAQSVPEDSLP